jgi:orotidine-5'-phosphate decarboxylase
VAAIKFNTKFFLEQGWFDELAILIQYTKSKSCIVIGDSKLADIGKSLSAGLQSSVNKKMDFETLDTRTSRVTVGIQKEFGQQIGLVAVALMSNKEAIEYNSTPEGGEEVLRYLKHVLDAGVVGVVIGGTYKNEQAFKDALEIIKKHESETGRKILILAPGFGAQGGNISEFLTTVKNAGLDPKQVMCNVGTSLMQPELGKTRTQVVKEFMDGAKSIF